SRGRVRLRGSMPCSGGGLFSARHGRRFLGLPTAVCVVGNTVSPAGRHPFLLRSVGPPSTASPKQGAAFYARRLRFYTVARRAAVSRTSCALRRSPGAA